MNLEWVNHASCIVEHGAVRLIMDPWLQGKVFNQGWSLLSPTKMTHADFSTISHIWFSHEHPDHFNPPDLARIAPETRSRITVLFQKTIDRKVRDHCTKLGFAGVRELEPGEWATLGEGLEVRCDPYADGDSWLCVRTPALTLLNTNDCVVSTAREAAKLRAQLPPIDVLMTQFSYASWAGNPGDLETPRAVAGRIFEQLGHQILGLQPKYVIPSASFIWFSHEENFHQNQGMNRIDRTYEFLTHKYGVLTVVLYPGERWTPPAYHDSAASIAKYARDYEALSGDPPLTKTIPADLDDIRTAAEAFRAKLLEKNARDALVGMKPTRFWVTDHGASYEFSFAGGLTEASVPFEENDIALSSESLLYGFRFLWGFNTLGVNARFTKPPQGDFKAFKAYQRLAFLNNQGRTVPNRAVRAFRSGVSAAKVAAVRLRDESRSLIGKAKDAVLADPERRRRMLRAIYQTEFLEWRQRHQSPQLKERTALYEHVFERESLGDAIDYLEFGVYRGASLRWWLERNKSPESRFVGFDTFEGLPEDWAAVRAGAYSAQGVVPDLEDPRCGFEVGFFHETLPRFLARGPLSRRTVVHLDADLYTSTLFVLVNLLPRLKPGDLLLFDEFGIAEHEYRAFVDALAACPVKYEVLAGTGNFYRAAFKLL